MQRYEGVQLRGLLTPPTLVKPGARNRHLLRRLYKGQSLRDSDYQSLIDAGLVEVQGDTVVIDERLLTYLPGLRLTPSSTDNLVISPATLVVGAIDNVYSDGVSASGGESPYTYAVSNGSLPTGLSLNASTGAITGTPTGSPGDHTFTIDVTDNDGRVDGARYTLSVVVLAATPALLPDGRNQRAYSQQLTGANGTGPYTFAVTGGALPTGITLSGAGLLSGTPTVDGDFTFEITITDDNGLESPQDFALHLDVVLMTITPALLPDGQDGVAYSQQLAGNFGVAPYTFAVTAGALPTGITLSGAGLLSGTPSVDGTFNFTITVTDDDANDDPQAFTLFLEVA